MKRFLAVTRVWILLLPLFVGFVGAASNQLVLAANHDKFPVMLSPRKVDQWKPDEQGMIDDVHCVMTKDTRLNFLADWIDLKAETDSPGDLLLDLGGYLEIFAPVIWALLMISDALRREREE